MQIVLRMLLLQVLADERLKKTVMDELKKRALDTEDTAVDDYLVSAADTLWSVLVTALGGRK